jgi:hypothetical protein
MTSTPSTASGEMSMPEGSGERGAGESGMSGIWEGDMRAVARSAG